MVFKYGIIEAGCVISVPLLYLKGKAMSGREVEKSYTKRRSFELAVQVKAKKNISTFGSTK